MMMLLLLCCSAAAAAVADALCASCEVVARGTRVQALSPTLLRVEPKGPQGFEGRSTFIVVNRTFTGVPASTRETAGGTNISTAYYSVLLREDRTFVVLGADGRRLYDSLATPPSNLLHWPSPLGAAAYVVEDRPRFVPPEWAPQPAPAGSPLAATSGYDFRNNIAGDVYVFLLGDTLEEWWASRAEFLRLTGPTPLLPDWAYGTWSTRWFQFTEEQVKYEIGRWESGRFPLDVWGLDMNWRLTNGTCCGAPSCRSQRSTDPSCEDHLYLPNTTDFPPPADTPPLQEWIRWMASKGLHTYLNGAFAGIADDRTAALLCCRQLCRRLSKTRMGTDHPFPQDKATTPKETAFRWGSLTTYLSRGLSFWW